MKGEFIAHVRKKDSEQQSPWTDLKEVSEIAGKFAVRVGLKESGETICLLQDAGKANRGLQV